MLKIERMERMKNGAWLLVYLIGSERAATFAPGWLYTTNAHDWLLSKLAGVPEIIAEARGLTSGQRDYITDATFEQVLPVAFDGVTLVGQRGAVESLAEQCEVDAEALGAELRLELHEDDRAALADRLGELMWLASALRTLADRYTVTDTTLARLAALMGAASDVKTLPAHYLAHAGRVELEQTKRADVLRREDDCARAA